MKFWNIFQIERSKFQMKNTPSVRFELIVKNRQNNEIHEIDKIEQS